MDRILEFEKEMLVNILNENSLTIASKGVAIDRLLLNIVRTYSASCHLVLIIGTHPPEEESILAQMRDNTEPEEDDFVFPNRMSYESALSQARREKYLAGGVHFISTRILVVDMLNKKLPFESVTGIVIANAHRVLNNCHMSFILRLYREHNKTGFVTALSQNAAAFTGSFGKLERIMRNLFVSKLYLWPRFHEAITSSFESRKTPNVTEIRLEMTPIMKEIQFILLDLISRCIKEFQSRSNIMYNANKDSEDPADETNALNTMNIVAKGFNKIIRKNLDNIWYQLTFEEKKLISDIRLLKFLLFYLTELDSVSFYEELRHIQSSVKLDKTISSWLFWEPTELLFKLTQDRVYTLNEDKVTKVFRIELNPKLEALSELLNEIEENIQSADDDDDVEEHLIDVIIIVKGRFAVSEIESFRDKGKEKVLDDLKKKFELINRGRAIYQQDSQGTSTQNLDIQLEIPNFDDNMTLTQMRSKISALEDDNGDEEFIIRNHKRMKITYYQWEKDGTSAMNLKRMLINFNPRHVIIYELEMSSIRQIEVYQALFQERESINVHILVFNGSAEEQRYLKNLQEEKMAFEKLIEEKSRLAHVVDADGIQGLHPDLIRGNDTLLHPDEIQPRNTRAGGFEPVSNAPKQVLVDNREFRSHLPAAVYKLGIDLVPLTLEIGDYILTPETVLERKSIPDLIGSLNSGRLYSQTQAMVRFYQRVFILIEFEEKAFNFDAYYWKSSQTVRANRPSPLVQLAVLCVHYPQVRLIWSPSSNFSAFIIDKLKEGKTEPDRHCDTKSTSNSHEIIDDDLQYAFDVDTKEFLLSLPGVTTANVYFIMQNVSSILALTKLSLDDLTKIMESSYHAKLLYNSLHNPTIPDSAADQRNTKNKDPGSRFSCVRKKPKK